MREEVHHSCGLLGSTREEVSGSEFRCGGDIRGGDGCRHRSMRPRGREEESPLVKIKTAYGRRRRPWNLCL